MLKCEVEVMKNGQKINTLEYSNESARNELLSLYKHFWKYKTKYYTNYKKVSITTYNNITRGVVTINDVNSDNVWSYRYLFEDK